MRPAAVDLQDVYRSFGPVRAVDGINLRLHLGEIAALLGPNGAGKTTTIDMVLGLGRADRGSVSVLGLSPSPPLPNTPIKFSTACARFGYEGVTNCANSQVCGSKITSKRRVGEWRSG